MKNFDFKSYKDRDYLVNLFSWNNLMKTTNIEGKSSHENSNMFQEGKILQKYLF